MYIAIPFLIIIFILVYLLKQQMDYGKNLEKTIEELRCEKNTKSVDSNDYEINKLIEVINKEEKNDNLSDNIQIKNEQRQYEECKDITQNEKNVCVEEIQQNDNKKNDEKINISNELSNRNFEEKKDTREIEKNAVDSEFRNTIILITGSILVVISAITFLISTWHVIPNTIKSLMLILLEGVFIKASKEAKEKINSPKVSKAFYYIVMAYIPILIFSFSAFDLIGNFLGKNGEGINIYYAVSGFIISVIYMISGEKRKDNILINSSIITQMITIALTTQIFTTEYMPAVLMLLVYVIIIKILSKRAIISNTDSNFALICDICLPILGIITIFNIIKEDVSFIEIINLILLEINYILKDSEDENIVYYIIKMIGIYIITISLTNLEFLQMSLPIKQVIFTVLTIAMTMYGTLETERKKIPMLIINAIAFEGLFVMSAIWEELYIKNYMILAIITGVAIIGYIVDSRKMRYIWRYVISFGIILTTLNMVVTLDLDYTILIGVSLIILALSDLKFINDNEFNNQLELFGNIFTIVSTLIAVTANFDVYISCTVIHLLAIFIYSRKYIGNEDKQYYKIGIYIFSNVAVYSICKILNVQEIRKYIIPATTLVIMAMEYLLEKPKNLYIITYLAVSAVISYIILTCYINLFSLAIIILITVGLYEYIKINKIDNKLNLIWIISIIPTLFFYKNIFVEEYINILVSMIATAVLTGLSIKEEKKELYIISSGIYLIMTSITFGFNVYLTAICGIIWASLEYMTNKKYEDIFKSIIYMAILILYNKIIEDLKLNNVTSLNLLGYIVVLNIFNRRIIRKYAEDTYKILEYIINILINYAAITMYTGPLDAMGYIILLLVMIFISYIYKLGPMFITTIATLLVNTIYLTREFWLMIPWWVYILLVGIVLITFAANNESKGQIEKIMKDKVSKIREYMDI